MKKYTYKDVTYSSLTDLRRVLAKEEISFGNPTSNEGWEAIGVKVEEYVVMPTAEELQKKYTDLIQKYMDLKAQELNYDSCLSVCSYIDTGVEKFDRQGEAFRTWRSLVWQKGYEILDDCIAGKRQIPTEEELLAELPVLDINAIV